MDNAVALIQAYLRVNGYFTIAEYPIIEAMRGGAEDVAQRKEGNDPVLGLLLTLEKARRGIADHRAVLIDENP